MFLQIFYVANLRAQSLVELKFIFFVLERRVASLSAPILPSTDRSSFLSAKPVYKNRTIECYWRRDRTQIGWQQPLRDSVPYLRDDPLMRWSLFWVKIWTQNRIIDERRFVMRRKNENVWEYKAEKHRWLNYVRVVDMPSEWDLWKIFLTKKTSQKKLEATRCPILHGYKFREKSDRCAKIGKPLLIAHDLPKSWKTSLRKSCQHSFEPFLKHTNLWSQLWSWQC